MILPTLETFTTLRARGSVADLGVKKDIGELTGLLEW